MRQRTPNRVDGLTGFFAGEVRLSHLSAEALRRHDLSAEALHRHGHVAYAYAKSFSIDTTGSRTTRFGKYGCNRSLHQLHSVPFMAG